MGVFVCLSSNGKAITDWLKLLCLIYIQYRNIYYTYRLKVGFRDPINTGSLLRLFTRMPLLIYFQYRYICVTYEVKLEI